MKNYGKIVDRNRKKKGVSKIHLTKLLKISRVTLDTRLKDGNFKEWQIEVLTTEGLI